MKNIFAALVLLPFLMAPALIAPAWAQGAADATAGKALWEGNNAFCKNCHGRNGEGAFGPDLAGRGLSAAQFQQAVRKPWGVMPSFTTEQVSDAELAGMAAYFATLPKTGELGAWRVPLATDAPHGQQVYVSAGCAQCHGVTFDMPRASFGGRKGDFALMKDLVYNHTTAMPKMEPTRPGTRLRMGNFDPLRLSESQMKEIYDWAHDDLGFRPALQARLVPGEGAATYALNLANGGEKGKGLVASGLVIDVIVPAGITVTGATGEGYKGVHTDAKGATVAEWQVSRLAPTDARDFSITLSQAPANIADLKGTVRWAKPAPRTGPNMDVVNFAARPAAPAR